MAVFEIPEQHEDGALRGVRAAVEMQEAFASLMAGLLAAYTTQAMVQIRLSRDLEASARSARTPMTVDELLAHFPEVPRDLRDEPILAEYVKAFGPLLRLAQKPSPC